MPIKHQGLCYLRTLIVKAVVKDILSFLLIFFGLRRVSQVSSTEVSRRETSGTEFSSTREGLIFRGPGLLQEAATLPLGQGCGFLASLLESCLSLFSRLWVSRKEAFLLKEQDLLERTLRERLLRRERFLILKKPLETPNGDHCGVPLLI
jgi:hypothetical protein